MSSKSSPTSKAAGRAAKAAELRREQEAAERRRRFLMIGGVLAVLVVLLGGAITASVLIDKKKENDLEKAVAGVGDSKYGLVIGPDDAPHHVVIYEDFLCPVCGYLEEHSHEELAKAAADGKVQVEYRPFDLLSHNVDADYPIRAAGAFSVVLDKSGPEVAKKYHDLLYANQPEESGPYLDDEKLVDLAVEAGAVEADVRPGIEGGSGEDWVTAATKEALDAGVRGTPTVLVDGQLFHNGDPVDKLTEALLKEVA
ncbi:DsbA family protein [Nocardioides sp. MH1]|uniref:DsbA family protein n=1 Tax=Nocardioides sp. MH1 TaxID=3242490 RepID=UPI0035213BA5